MQRGTLFREPSPTLSGLQVLSTAIAMLQSLMAKITSRMTNKPAGADDADLEKLRFVVEVAEVEPCQQSFVHVIAALRRDWLSCVV